MNYQLTDRTFSRIWRRNKTYSEREIRWLAKKRGFIVKYEGIELHVVNPSLNKNVANFKQSADISTHASEPSNRLHALASLKVSVR